MNILRTWNREETIKKLKDQPTIALILMDIKMPGIDGFETTRRIREFNKTIPIIAQTAYAFTGDKERALEAGCNDYISKPINIQVLVKIINHYI
jgi:CheY-like chemotaxis protein